MHLNRINAPKNWNIKRKSSKWIVRPSPGSHSINRCLPLSIIIRDILGYADTVRESKKILHNKEILINKKPVTNHRSSVGIMDILEINKAGKFFIMAITEKNHLTLKEINKEQANQKISKIINKIPLKGGKIQVNCHDTNTFVLKDKKEDKYTIGDSVIFDLNTKKVVKHLKLEKGAVVYLLAGKYVGKKGIVNEIIKKKYHQDVVSMTIGKEEAKTLKNYTIVIEDKAI
ncbi:MAG: 30S ribosomal protein S4e [Nanoarchaeota archaeon]|nr:30S ribosomal protein S4e [Nanoarchaeota archaeon]